MRPHVNSFPWLNGQRTTWAYWRASGNQTIEFWEKLTGCVPTPPLLLVTSKLLISKRPQLENGGWISSRTVIAGGGIRYDLWTLYYQSSYATQARTEFFVSGYFHWNNEDVFATGVGYHHTRCGSSAAASMHFDAMEETLAPPWRGASSA